MSLYPIKSETFDFPSAWMASRDFGIIPIGVQIFLDSFLHWLSQFYHEFDIFLIISFTPAKSSTLIVAFGIY